MRSRVERRPGDERRPMSARQTAACSLSERVPSGRSVLSRSRDPVGYRLRPAGVCYFGALTVARSANTIRLLASVRSIPGTAPGIVPPPQAFR